jgi:phytoene/squalene synthetase
MVYSAASPDIHHHNWVTYLLSRFFLRTRERKASYKLYTYLRRVDDFIDESGVDKETCLQYIKEQRALVKDLYGNGKVCRDHLLNQIIDHDRQNGRKFQECIDLMMDVFEFDAGRKHTVVSEAELHSYSLNLARAYTHFLVHFVAPGYQHTINDVVLAHACHLAHMIRDLSIDNGLGYFNIAREDIKQFALKPGQYTNGKYSQWLKKEIEYIDQLMVQGKCTLRHNPLFTVKIIGFLYCFRYETIMRQIKKNHYRLSDDYKLSLGDMLRLMSTIVRISIGHICHKLVHNIVLSV